MAGSKTASSSWYFLILSKNNLLLLAGSKTIKSAFVPGYSPNAIAELAVSLTMALLRNIVYTVERTSKQDFIVTDQLFSREIRGCTVGILGCGRIGRTAAKFIHGLGAKVIGYDLYPVEEAKEYMEYVSFEEIAKRSDVISIHLNYIKGQNDNLVDAKFVSMMKEHAILIDTGCGEVVDFEAVLDAVEAGKLDGFGADVVKNETKLFFKDRTGLELEDKIHQRMISLFPKVLITPHIGSATNLALRDMIEISLKNMEEILKTGTCKNTLTEK